MTDYVKSTSFASKDSLASGNPLKIVKGTEIDIEFNNIATAVASKADIANPNFSGIPLAPTATAGTNTTQLATTAFATSAISAAIAAVKEALYPVGSIYTNATVNTNPAALLGFGTWVEFGAGRVPVGFNAGNALFNTVEKTGGSYDASLVGHTHTGTTGGQTVNHTHAFSGTTDGAGAHYHSVASSGESGSTGLSYVAGAAYFAGYTDTTSVGAHAHNYSGNTTGVSADHGHGFTTDTSGGTATNTNIQPYITVYMWKRTA